MNNNFEYQHQASAEKHREVFAAGGGGAGQGGIGGEASHGQLNLRNQYTDVPANPYGGHQNVLDKGADDDFLHRSYPVSNYHYQQSSDSPYNPSPSLAGQPPKGGPVGGAPYYQPEQIQNSIHSQLPINNISERANRFH